MQLVFGWIDVQATELGERSGSLTVTLVTGPWPMLVALIWYSSTSPTVTVLLWSPSVLRTSDLVTLSSGVAKTGVRRLAVNTWQKPGNVLAAPRGTAPALQNSLAVAWATLLMKRLRKSAAVTV